VVMRVRDIQKWCDLNGISIHVEYYRELFELEVWYYEKNKLQIQEFLCKHIPENILITENVVPNTLNLKYVNEQRRYSCL